MDGSSGPCKTNKKPTKARKNHAGEFVKPILWPDDFLIQQLNKSHKRHAFHSGVEMVDEWLKKGARQAQEKQLSVTRVLLKEPNTIIGYYTLAMGQVNFDELPHEMARKLPGTLLDQHFFPTPELGKLTKT